MEGKHYLPLWDPEEHDDNLEGEEFILAGYGMHGKILNSGREGHLKDNPVFHRGYNNIDSITKNLI